MKEQTPEMTPRQALPSQHGSEPGWALQIAPAGKQPGGGAPTKLSAQTPHFPRFFSGLSEHSHRTVDTAAHFFRILLPCTASHASVATAQPVPLPPHRQVADLLHARFLRGAHSSAVARAPPAASAPPASARAARSAPATAAAARGPRARAIPAPAPPPGSALARSPPPVPRSPGARGLRALRTLRSTSRCVARRGGRGTRGDSAGGGVRG